MSSGGIVFWFGFRVVLTAECLCKLVATGNRTIGDFS